MDEQTRAQLREAIYKALWGMKNHGYHDVHEAHAEIMAAIDDATATTWTLVTANAPGPVCHSNVEIVDVYVAFQTAGKWYVHDAVWRAKTARFCHLPDEDGRMKPLEAVDAWIPRRLPAPPEGGA